MAEKHSPSNKMASEWKYKVGVSNKVTSEWTYSIDVSTKRPVIGGIR